MDIDEIQCEYCDSAVSASSDGCENCGAARVVLTNAYSQRLEEALHNVLDVLDKSQKSLRLSKIRLALSSMALVVIIAAFWPRIQSGLRGDDYLISQLQQLGNVQEGQVGNMQSKVRFAEVLTAVSSLRYAIHEEYLRSHNWPSTFRDMGIEESELNGGKYISSVQLGSGGQLLVNLSEDFGPDARISLQAKALMAGGSMEWECTTNVIISGRSYFDCGYNAAVKMAEL